MTSFTRALKTALPAALLFAAAAPALAQTPPPPPPGAGAPRGFARDRPGPMQQRNPFSTLSDAGRATMREAMQGDKTARQADRQAVRAARDRMLAVLDAERLDIAALKRAMNDERVAANGSRERFQASMLAGFQKLSVADRRAFVAEAKALKSRMEERMRSWHGRGGDDDLPEPPPLF